MKTVRSYALALAMMMGLMAVGPMTADMTWRYLRAHWLPVPSVRPKKKYRRVVAPSQYQRPVWDQAPTTDNDASNQSQDLPVQGQQSPRQ